VKTDERAVEIFEKYVVLLKTNCLNPGIKQCEEELEKLRHSIEIIPVSCSENSSLYIVWTDTFILRDNLGRELTREENLDIQITKKYFYGLSPIAREQLGKKYRPERDITFEISLGPVNLLITAQDLKFLRSFKISTENLDNSES